jgi:inner membrane protein
MDPICHTLVGATLARSGLSRRTAFGTATLLIGANLPDIDILAYLDGPAADLSFRRGWTHGIPALIVLPFLLTGAMMLFDRLVRRLGRATLPAAVVPGQILLLAGIAVFTHPVLDSLNTYGIRWLMPFSDRWFYGDTLFIVDPWLWVVLAVGFALSGAERRGRTVAGEPTRPARAALMIAGGYIAAMALTGWMARRLAGRELMALTGERVEALMVGPTPVTPVARDVVAAQGSTYRVARFRWLRPHIDPASVRSYARGRPTDPAVALASETELGRRFLSWARFPIIETERSPSGATLVHMIDLRYARRPGAGFGTITIRVPATTASRSASRSPPPFPPDGSGAPVP